MGVAMSITSPHFVLFTLATVGLYTAARHWASPWIWDLIFLVANVAFLWTFSVDGWLGALPMVAFIGLGGLGIAILRHRRDVTWVWGVLGFTIAYFFWIKKYAFVPDGLLLHSAYTTIGLSYIFFRILQLLIDTGSGHLEERPGLVQYLNYLLNFTTLISGPIQRYEDFVETREHPKPVTWPAFGRTIERIAVGTFKLIVLAALFLALHRQALSALNPNTGALDGGLTGATILVTYTLYLYCNFSGYTDIVIGIGRLLGMQLPENFDRPFSSLNFMEFWGRWHMTLSNWLKTYVYNPLAKSLMSRFPSPAADPYLGVVAFLVTFFLIGLWHGQTVVFVLYGLLLGMGVSGNKLYQVLMVGKLGRKKWRTLTGHCLYQALARGLTFTYFAVSLVCFWASWDEIRVLVGALGWVGVTLATATIFVGAVLILDLWERIRQGALSITLRGRPMVLSRYVRTSWVTTLVLVTAAVAALVATPAPDIVYKNF
jgi:D-alanyl-lipoteichoic acid acyltransferase DltB (MBOAT superfamily)